MLLELKQHIFWGFDLKLCSFDKIYGEDIQSMALTIPSTNQGYHQWSTVQHWRCPNPKVYHFKVIQSSKRKSSAGKETLISSS